VIYGKLTVHDGQTDRQTDKVHVEITRKGQAWLYTTENTFIALGWRSEMNYGLTWIYRTVHDYIIRIMSMLRHLLYIQLLTKPYNVGFPAPGCTTIALCHFEHICDQGA